MTSNPQRASRAVGVQILLLAAACLWGCAPEVELVGTVERCCELSSRF